MANGMGWSSGAQPGAELGVGRSSPGANPADSGEGRCEPAPGLVLWLRPTAERHLQQHCCIPTPRREEGGSLCFLLLLLLPAAGDGLTGRQTDGRASLREEQCREKRPVMAQGRKVPDKRGIVSGAKRKQMPAGAGAFQSTPRALGAAAGTRQGGGGHNKWQSPFPVGSGSCFSSAEHKEPRCKAAIPQRCARMGLSPRSRAHRGSAAEGLLPPPHEAQPRSTPVAPTRPINAPQRTGQLRGCTRSATELTFGDGYLRNLPPAAPSCPTAPDSFEPQRLGPFGRQHHGRPPKG